VVGKRERAREKGKRQKGGEQWREGNKGIRGRD